MMRHMIRCEPMLQQDTCPTTRFSNDFSDGRNVLLSSFQDHEKEIPCTGTCKGICMKGIT